MATVAEVIDRTAGDLGLLRLGQVLQAQDNTRITAAYNEVHAQLKKEGLATWASTGAIPTELVPHVAALMADNCLSNYGVSLDRFKRIKIAVASAMPEIRRLTATHYASQSEPSDY